MKQKFKFIKVMCLAIVLACCLTITAYANETLISSMASTVGVELKTVGGNNYFVNVPSNIKLSSFTQLGLGDEIYVESATSARLSKNDLAATGQKVFIKDGTNTESAFLCVSADVNGDGKISAVDYVRIKNHIMKTSVIKDQSQLYAADANKDGSISSLDYIRIKKIIMNGEVTKPVVNIGTHVYTGYNQTISVVSSNYYTVSGNTGTNAGEYTLTIALKDKNNYVWSDGTTADIVYKWTIEKATVDMSKVKFENRVFAYSGEAHYIYVDETTLPSAIKEVKYKNNGFVGTNSEEKSQVVTASFVLKNDNYKPVADMKAKITVTQVLRYHINYLVNGNSIGTDVVTVGQAYEFKKASVDGYDFLGWYVASDNKLITTYSGTKLTEMFGATSNDQNVTFVAMLSSKTNYDSGMAIKATADTIEMKIGKCGTAGKFYPIYELNAAQYWFTETQTGQGTYKVNTGNIVGYYIGQSNAIVTINRYDDTKYDRIYRKFIIADGEDVAAGPYWVTDISSQLAYNDYSYAQSALTSLIAEFNPLKTKKGIVGNVNKDYAEELGVGYKTAGMLIKGLIMPNEIVDTTTGDIVENRGYDYYHDLALIAGADEQTNPDAGSKKYIEWYSNGKYYYFERNALYQLDQVMLANYQLNVYSLAILQTAITDNQEEIPYFMMYEGVADFKQNAAKAGKTAEASYQQVNTGNDIGADYWIALSEFLAWRYSELGLVDIIVGNEVDFCGSWNVSADYTKQDVTMEQYTEEIYRQLRLTTLGVEKYNKDIDVSVPFTHYWSVAGSEGGTYKYVPLQMSEYLLRKAKAEGNFDFGYALHDSPSDMTGADGIGHDIILGRTFDGFLKAKNITISNIEIFQQYLEQDYALCNGKVRAVYLSESGVAAGNVTKEEQAQQAASIAYHYYKISMLDCIKAWTYYRVMDHAAEGANFGLYSAGPTPRYAALVYADCGVLDITEFNLKYRDYIQSIGFSSIGDYEDYATLMVKTATKFRTGYDWATAWKNYYGYDVKTNYFTVEPTDISVDYTGKAIEVSGVEAYKGYVCYKFFDSKGQEIDSIVDAGTYSYKAYVVGTASYNAIESSAKTITVNKATNDLIYDVVDGVINLSYFGTPVTLPTSVLKFGQSRHFIMDSEGQEVTSMTPGEYELNVGGDQGTDNYGPFAARKVKIVVWNSYAVGTYDELMDALEECYKLQIPDLTIELKNDIDCQGKEINYNDYGKAFISHFNGHGYTIGNFKITDATKTRVGLFTRVGDGADIHSLVLGACTISLDYRENDTKYTEAVGIGMLAGEVVGTKAKIYDITVNSGTIRVNNESAKDHEMYVGGVIGIDTATSEANLSEYSRKNIANNYMTLNFTENSTVSGIGGIVGRIVGSAPDATATQSMVVFNNCDVVSGNFKMYNPAGGNESAMGGYIGTITNYAEVNFVNGCSANPELVRYDSRVVSYTYDKKIVDTIIPDPNAKASYAAYMPSVFYYVYNNAQHNLLGWVGNQTNITVNYYTTSFATNSVGGTTYKRATFNMEEGTTCDVLMRCMPYYEREITIAEEDLINGFDLASTDIYIGDIKSDILFFRSEKVRRVAYQSTWSTADNNYAANIYTSMFTPTAGIEGAGNANCIAYVYDPNEEMGELGWIKPWDRNAYLDPSDTDHDYAVKTLTIKDFKNLDTITLYGCVTSKDTSRDCISETIKLTIHVDRTDKKTEEKAVVFLGDSVCASAQYIADTKGVLNNYIVNPVELRAQFGTWTNSSGWAYFYALEHKSTMVYNYAIGGATMGVYQAAVNYTIPNQYLDFKTVYPNQEVGKFVIEMSFNDVMGYGLLSDLGKSVLQIADLTQPLTAVQRKTTLGALVTLIQDIRKDYPDAEIVMILPTQRYDELYVKGQAESLAETIDAYKTICQRLQLPVIDLYNKTEVKCTLDGGKTWNVAMYNANEGVHPNYWSYKYYLYPAVKKYLDGKETSVLMFDCTWVDQKQNSFVVPATEKVAEFTPGEVIIDFGVQAKYGEVQYKIYNRKYQEVELLDDADTYYYKAFVPATINYTGLESDYVKITVTKKNNEPIYNTLNKEFSVPYVAGGVELPESIMEFGTPTMQVLDANGQDVTGTKLERGRYTVIVGPTSEGMNYYAFAGETYTLLVSGDADDNSFTSELKEVVVNYTGLAADLKLSATASFGTVTFKYFDSNKEEIQASDIVNAGEYYYKAKVEGTYVYEGLESDYKKITVLPTKNGFFYEMKDNVGQVPYENNGAIPTQWTLFGTATATITKKGETTPLGEGDKLEKYASYIVELTAIEETDNYGALAAASYEIVILAERQENEFLVEATDLEYTYTGSALEITPNVESKYGTVTFKFFNANGDEVQSITNAGEYTYKAYVALNIAYTALESDAKKITVNKADNSLISGFAATNGVIKLDYTTDHIEIPTALTTKTPVPFVVKDVNGQTVSTLVIGEYSLTFDADYLANYNGVEENYTIIVGETVEVADKATLTAVLTDYYTNPSEITIKLTDNISFSGGLWKLSGNAPFVGTFDGNGKKITNVIFADTTAKQIGLFGQLGGNAVVKDLKIENAVVALEYPEGDKSYAGAVNVGILASKIVSKTVTLSGVTVSNSTITINNMSSTDHSMTIGGMVGYDCGVEEGVTTGRKSLVVSNLTTKVRENAKNVWIGGYAGAIDGSAKANHYLEVQIQGGQMSLYDPARANTSAMGSYIGTINADEAFTLTFASTCTSSIKLILHEARQIIAKGGGVLTQSGNPGDSRYADFAYAHASRFNYTSGGTCFMGWIGSLAGSNGDWLTPITAINGTVVAETGAQCTGVDETRGYDKMSVTLTSEDLENGYDLYLQPIYLGNEKLSLTFFTYDIMSARDLTNGKINLKNAGAGAIGYGNSIEITFQPTIGGTKHAIGYIMNSNFSAFANYQYGFCIPTDGARFINPVAEGYALEKLTEEDFETEDMVTLYAVVTSKANGSTGWYEVIEIEYSIERTNEFIVEPEDVEVSFTGDALADDPAVTFKYGDNTKVYTYYNENGEVISKDDIVDPGVYGYSVKVEYGSNYSGLESGIKKLIVSQTYKVSTAEELCTALAAFYDNPTSAFKIILQSDIDAEGAQWPEANGIAFTGTLDGNGKKISNAVFGATGKEEVGFFELLGKDAVVKNLTIDKATITLDYPEGDSKYTNGVSVGILAGRIIDESVVLSGVTVSNSKITVNNMSAVDHKFAIGGMVGFDCGVEDNVKDARTGLVISNINIAIVENAENIWAGGYAGQISGVSGAYHYLDVKVQGGQISLLDPARGADSGLGAYIGNIDSNGEYSLTFASTCESSVNLILHEARQLNAAGGGKLTQNGAPGFKDDYAFDHASKFNYTSGGTNFYGWVGSQTGTTGSWLSAITNNAGTVVAETGASCTGTDQTKAYSQKQIVLSSKDLADGYTLSIDALYKGTEKLAVDFFVSGIMDSRNLLNGKVTLANAGTAAVGYGNTIEIIFQPVIQSKAYQIGYIYSSSMSSLANYQYGYCFPATATFFNPAQFGYTKTQLTAADFAEDTTITMFAVVRGTSNGSTGWYEVVEIDYTLKDENSFVTAPADLDLAYTGNAISEPAVEAAFGNSTKVFTYYDAEGDEIELADIVNPGEYAYKVTVPEGATYDAIESEVKKITITKKYEVGTFADLEAAMDAFYAAPTTFFNIKLTADIDAEGAEWTHGGDAPFTGVFDGNGKTIKNLKFSDLTANEVGFFNQLGEGAVVKNLTIDAANVSLIYPEGDDKYDGSVSVGILASKIASTDVTLTGITVSNAAITVKNMSAVDHKFAIGGMVGYDCGVEADNNAGRVNLVVSKLNVAITENAENIWAGGYAGQISGEADAYHYLDVKVDGGQISLLDPARGEDSGLGAYIGNIDANEAYSLTFASTCDASISLVLHESRQLNAAGGGKLTQNGAPGFKDDYAFDHASKFNYTSGGTNFMCWVGSQTNAAGTWLSAITNNAGTVVAETGAKCTSTDVTKAYSQKATVIKSSEIEGEYTLSVEPLYKGTEKLAVDFFTADIRSSKTLLNSQITAANAGTSAVGYANKSIEIIFQPVIQSKAYQIGYIYSSSMASLPNYQYGYCFPATATFFNPAQFGYTKTQLTAADFVSEDIVTMYAVYRGTSNGSTGWYEVVEIDFSVEQ